MSLPPPMRDPYATDAPYQVVIAGAGLAGSSLALRLAREGLRVAILDPSTFPRPKICGEFLSPECWDAFDDLGLADAITRVGYEPIRRVRISTPRGREVIAEVVGPDGRPGIGLSRFVLDDLLLQAARAAGAQVFEGVRASGALVEEGRVVGVAGRSASNDPVEFRGSVTVAADGRQSSLVKQTGTTRPRSWFRPRLFGLKRHFDLQDFQDGEQPGTVGLHLIPGGYGGTCRVDGGSTNLCALLPEKTVQIRRGKLDQVAAECLGANPALARLLDRGTPAGEWKTVAGVQVQVSRPKLPGILFAGDCQGTVDPLGGQGMTMALLGSSTLVPYIKAGLLRGGRGITRTMQDAWADDWHHQFDRRVRLCQAFHHFLIHPKLTDLVSTLGPAAARFLAACYRKTRDNPHRRRPFAPTSS